LDLYFKLVPVQTNSKGLRDREYSIVKPENTFRIAVVGDSFTMPSGVKFDESYPERLEVRLNAESWDFKYEVINFAVGEYSVRQYWAVIKHKIQTYDPDLILIGYCTKNDHKIPDAERFQNSFVVKNRSYPFFKSFVYDALNLICNDLKSKLSKHKKQRKSIKSPPLITEDQAKYLSDYFSRMNGFEKQLSIPIIILCLAIDYNENYSRILEQLVTDHNLDFCDVSTAFRDKSFKDYMIYPIDPHPNNDANSKFAERVYDHLRKNYIGEPRETP